MWVRRHFCTHCGHSADEAPFGDRDFFYPETCVKCGSGKNAHTSRICRRARIQVGEKKGFFTRKMCPVYERIWEIRSTEKKLYDKTCHNAVPTPNVHYNEFDEDENGRQVAIALQHGVSPTRDTDRNAVIDEVLEKIQSVRHQVATSFTPECSGQRGVDKCDALYDAYQAVKGMKG